MKPFSAHHGLSTLVNHYSEGEHPLNAHLAPIFQSATFSFPDVETGIAIETGEQFGYIYTRGGNPNARQLARQGRYAGRAGFAAPAAGGCAG